MQTRPRISVVTPTRNRQRFIARLLRQFMRQDYSGPAELLVIEDGDEDCSDLLRGESAWRWVLRKFGPLPERTIRYFRFEGSIGRKLNFAAQQSRGEWLARMDDDDWQAPDRLTKQLAIAEMSRKPVLGMCSGLFWREGDTRAWEYHGDSWTAPGYGQFYRRDYALTHPHQDLSVREDIEFAAAAREIGALATVSGFDIAVCANHDANTCTRDLATGGFYLGELFLKCDNWREVPLDRIKAVIDGQ